MASAARRSPILAILLFTLPLAQSATLPTALPDAPSAVTPARTHSLPQHPHFFSSNLNRSLVAGEFTARLLDAISTRQFVTDPCHCIFERGSFYGLFSLKPVAASAPLQYSYSLGMAAGMTGLSVALWNHAEHSRHKKLYRLASRGLLIYDTGNDAIAGPANNWRLIATGGKRGL